MTEVRNKWLYSLLLCSAAAPACPTHDPWSPQFQKIGFFSELFTKEDYANPRPTAPRDCCCSILGRGGKGGCCSCSCWWCPRSLRPRSSRSRPSGAAWSRCPASRTWASTARCSTRTTAVRSKSCLQCRKKLVSARAAACGRFRKLGNYPLSH